MNVIIIDSLIGNDYSLNLCRELEKLVDKLVLIVPKNRRINAMIDTEVKYWAPSKNPGESKIIKVLGYVFYLLRLFTYIIFTSKNNVVHFQFFRRKFDIYLFILLRAFGVNLVYTAHNVFPHEQKTFDKLRTNLILKAANKTIVHSAFIKNKILKQFRSSNDKISIIPHGNFDNYLIHGDLPLRKQEKKQGLNLKILFYCFSDTYVSIKVWKYFLRHLKSLLINVRLSNF